MAKDHHQRLDSDLHMHTYILHTCALTQTHKSLLVLLLRLKLPWVCPLKQGVPYQLAMSRSLILVLIPQSCDKAQPAATLGGQAAQRFHGGGAKQRPQTLTTANG